MYATKIGLTGMLAIVNSVQDRDASLQYQSIRLFLYGEFYL